MAKADPVRCPLLRNFSILGKADLGRPRNRHHSGPKLSASTPTLQPPQLREPLGITLICTPNNNNTSFVAMASPRAPLARVIPRVEATCARCGGRGNGGARRWMSNSQSTTKRPKTAIFFPGMNHPPPPLGMKRRVANEYQARACSALA